MRPFGRGGRGFGGGPEFDRMGGGRGLGGGGYGRRRIVDGSELRLVLLSLIAGAPRHGYDLIRSIEELSGGAYAPSPGIVYPALAMMADIGLIAASEQAGGRKTFSISPAGEAELAARAKEIEALQARLKGLAGTDAAQNAPVRRAMDNLKAVLGNTLNGEGGVDPHAVAALIDEAASKIERLG